MHLPRSEDPLRQDEEWFELEEAGQRRRLRFHDYDQIFDVPGLYEELFHNHLHCDSPRFVRQMLGEVLAESGEQASDLRLLDVGAGNGMVGEELRTLGIGQIVGMDLLEEARDAALRDRSSVYEAYYAADLTALEPRLRAKLREHRFNSMACVAALGFGDIPVEAFLEALELIESPGWVAFTIHEDFLERSDEHGFHGVVADLLRAGVLRVDSYRRFRHRMSVRGEPLYYAAIVARKRSSVHTWRVERAERRARAKSSAAAPPADQAGGIFGA